MGNEENNKNLAEWRKLQEIGEVQTKKFGLDSEEKIVESLQVSESNDFIKQTEEL